MPKVKVLLFGPLIIDRRRSIEFSFEKKQISLSEFKKSFFESYPEFQNHQATIAINQTVSRSDSKIKDGDEIALLPPISGGNISYLTTEKITREYRSELLRTTKASCGSILKFEGIVRADEHTEKSKKNIYVEHIIYSAYEAMAEKEIAKIVDRSIKEFDLINVAIKHRLGKVKLNETAFFVAVFSSHRKEGIKAIDFIIDEVKRNVPIWKEEYFSDGSSVFKPGQPIK